MNELYLNGVNKFTKLISNNDKPDQYQNDNEACAQCGGICCKNSGCGISPDDLGLQELLDNDSLATVKGKIQHLLNTGIVSIDWWEGNPVTNEVDGITGYFLRMRNKNAPIVDPSWGGECLLLQKHGCILLFKNRPKQGRWLIPHKNPKEDCNSLYDKQQLAIDWMPYNKILEEIKEEMQDLDPAKDTIFENIEFIDEQQQKERESYLAFRDLIGSIAGLLEKEEDEE